MAKPGIKRGKGAKAIAREKARTLSRDERLAHLAELVFTHKLDLSVPAQRREVTLAMREAYGVADSTISEDIDELDRRYRERQAVMIDERKGREVAELYDFERQVIEHAANAKKPSMRLAWLKLRLAVKIHRADVEGFFAPKSIKGALGVFGPTAAADGKAVATLASMNPQERAARIAEIFEQAKKREARQLASAGSEADSVIDAEEVGGESTEAKKESA